MSGLRRHLLKFILGALASLGGLSLFINRFRNRVDKAKRLPAKRVRRATTAKENHWVGNGFFVSTIISTFEVPYEMISPFVLLDHADVKYFPPTEKKLGVGEHPHRGFETVTFAIEGEVEHRDSGGGGGVISTGDVQWMTAASGVVHDEFHSREFAKTGGDFSMVQLWVNLPARYKMNTPRYQSLSHSNFPKVTLVKDKVYATLIAGELKKEKGPAKTHSPMTIYRLYSEEKMDVELPFEEGTNTLLFVLKGSINIDSQFFAPRSMAIMTREGASVTIKMDSGSEVLVLNGEPIDEPIVHYGPFVMNTQSEIQQAILDFQAGKMGSLVSEEGS